jgi:hypothetical protein
MTNDEQDSHNAFATVMGTTQGRRFVMDILESNHWGEEIFASEPTALGFNVGVQSVPHKIFRRAEELQPELTGVMLKERSARRDALAKEMRPDDS